MRDEGPSLDTAISRALFSTDGDGWGAAPISGIAHHVGPLRGVYQSGPVQHYLNTAR